MNLKSEIEIHVSWQYENLMRTFLGPVLFVLRNVCKVTANSFVLLRPNFIRFFYGVGT